MRIIRRYLALTIARSIVVAVTVLFALFVFFTFLEEIEDGHGGLSYALTRTALFMPSIGYEVTPMCILIGVLVGLGTLAQNRELVVLRASGLSRAMLAAQVARISLVGILFGMVAGELVAPSALTRATLMHETQAKASGAEQEAPQWLHDGPHFIEIGHAAGGRMLVDITQYTFDEAGVLREALHAEQARYEDGAWTLYDVRVTRLAGSAESPLTLSGAATEHAALPWTLSLRPAVVSLAAIPPERLGLPAMAQLLYEMRNTGQSADAYLQSFSRRHAYPVAALAMVMLAIPMALGPRPRSSGGRQVITGLLIGLGFYLANQLTASLGTVYGLHPLVAALAPTLLLGGAAWWMNRRAV